MWAGKPVNYAVKCAGRADRHQLIATATVYERFADNDFVTHSWGCGNFGVPTPLWTDAHVERLGKHASCRLLQTGWCPTHGDEFCAAILDGTRNRDDVTRPEAA